MKLWQKNTKLNKLVEKFTVGNDYVLDQQLVVYDCLASVAHAKMLAKVKLIKPVEAKKLTQGLTKIMNLAKHGKFKILPTDEDCHTAIENYLTKELGDLGKKIHTARSRNDQVLTALRLYYKDELQDVQQLTKEVLAAIKKFVQKYGAIKFAGYTHTRKAMPSSVKLWAQSFSEALADDLKLLACVQELINQSPLGSGAGYGLPLKIDRAYTARLLKFARVQNNPLYAQLSRGKFEATILHVLGQIMFNLNKLATDLIIFTLPELDYFILPVDLTTGSSIMPQKKNPDVLELLRAKYHIVTGLEFQIKSLISNLPSGYNRDLQLTKEPIMNGLQIAKESLQITTLLFTKLKVDRQNCQKSLTPEVFATQQAYQLVKKGVPFREAYRQVAKKF